MVPLPAGRPAGSKPPGAMDRVVPVHRPSFHPGKGAEGPAVGAGRRVVAEHSPPPLVGAGHTLCHEPVGLSRVGHDHEITESGSPMAQDEEAVTR